jgi:hypothetical protein
MANSRVSILSMATWRYRALNQAYGFWRGGRKVYVLAHLLTLLHMIYTTVVIAIIKMLPSLQGALLPKAAPVRLMNDI